MNPVRAGLVEKPKQWRWSSYRALAGHTPCPVWLEEDWTLKLYGRKKDEARRHYQRFVLDGIGAADPHDEIQNGFLLGSPQFVHWIWESQTNGKEEFKDHPREQRIVGRPSLAEIFADIQTKKERNMAIKFARIRCGYLATEIARYIGLDRAVVGRISNGRYNRSRKKKVRSQT